MHRKRLLWHLFPSYLLITLIALLAAIWFTSRSSRNFYLQHTERDLIARAQMLRNQVSENIFNQNYQALDALCKSLGEETSTRITVILPNGKVVADSHEYPREMELHDNRPEIIAAFNGRVGKSTRRSPTLKRRLSYAAIPIFENERVVGVIRTSIPVTAINQPLRNLQSEFLLGGLIVALVSGIISLLVARRISRPLEEMTHGAERFAEGDLAHTLELPRSREMAGLAQAMNKMAAQLHDKIRTILQQRNEQEAMLSSMVEGVIAIDSEEHLISINQAAATMFDLNPVETLGLSIQEAIRNTQLQRFVKKALSRREPVEGEILLHDETERYLQAHGSVLRDGQGNSIGALIVLNDVTRLRRLENLRRDFVANVSHELKTPVTSIKGFVETLQNGALDDPADAQRFLTIIARQADRLNAIIADLLTLSRIEQDSERTRISLESTNISELLTNAVQACDVKASNKHITISVSCAEELIAPVNGALLEQAVINLVDNAIKYSEEGSKIEIDARQDNGDLAIHVRDYGVGIEREHLPRLFERFYRVDKARSRKMGGTGLGLAIVKHITQIHRGRVSVESIPGKGSLFSIYLPYEPHVVVRA